MKLNKKLAQYKFVIGCIGDEDNIGTNNGNYEQYARITVYRTGSDTYRITVEEFDSSFGDMTNELDYFEEFICNKRKAHALWDMLFLKYSGLEEVYHTNPY